MRKFMLLIFLAFIYSPAFSATSECLKGILALENWILSEEQIQCMEAREEIQVSLAQLCSNDQKTYSKDMATYLDYHRSYNNILQATDFKNDASKAMGTLELSDLEQDWKARGFKDEIETLLWPFSGAKQDCAK